jgi:hypothetical protein
MILPMPRTGTAINDIELFFFISWPVSYEKRLKNSLQEAIVVFKALTFCVNGE